MSTSYGAGTPPPGQPIYVPVPMQPRPSVLSRLFGLLQWVMFALFVLVMVSAFYMPDALSGDGDNKLEERYHSLNKDAVSKVAIITIDGTIMDGEDVKKQIDKVRDDKEVKAVVVRVDSPGGTVTGSDFIHKHLGDLAGDRKLPMVVSMGGLAASGGYYVSMAHDPEKDKDANAERTIIYAEPTTWTGSIGVIIPHYNVAGLMEKWQIEDDSIKSGKFKAIGTPTKKMTEEEKKIFEELVKQSFDRFKGIVKAGRPKITEQQMTDATTGQVFTTKQAMELGLVDHEGFLENAIDRAIDLAQLKKESTKVVKYRRPQTLMDTLIGVTSARRKTELQQLLDLTSPRAYYLFSWPQE